MKLDTLEYLERVSLQHKDTAVFKNHFARYEFAQKYVRKKIVLDAGCGTDYGTAYLSKYGGKLPV